MGPDLRVGDIVRVSCPYTPARVTAKSRYHVTVEWPWWSADPDCGPIKWSGEVVLACDPAAYEWENQLFRTDPAAERLAIGVTCRVGIPPTLVHVVSVDHFDPPLETGRLPRPRRSVLVLHVGQSLDDELAEQGYDFDPDDDIPMSFDLVFRPFACLVAGDEVADAAGRAWTFKAPWDWVPFDGAEPREPMWPLTLLARGGRADDAAAGVVAKATRHGSHQREVARWAELARPAPHLRQTAMRLPKT